MAQKKPPFNPRTTFQNDTDSVRVFKGGKAGAQTPGASGGAKAPAGKKAQIGPSNKGKR